MKSTQFLRILCLVFLVVAGVIGCKKDKDIVAKPTIDNLEIGTANSKKAFAGSDLHLEADLAAAGTLENVVVEITSTSAGGWQFSEAFTEGITGTKNANLHEHIDIPATVAPGAYRIFIKVTDKAGQVTIVESELIIEKQNPSAALVFTKVTGEGLEAHGDHFHGLGTAIDGSSDTVTFDDKGTIIANGHLHLEATGIYKVALKTYDASGNETQNKFIANAATAENYKAFLIGGNFVLNPNTTGETGAIFQTRETTYADGTAVTGGATKTTGVISYFIAGIDNKAAKDVTFVMRKVNPGVKPTITRLDWNRTDYATAFAGTNELELKFEIHAE
ncbi:DUF4625 domain-containing protein [Longitalea luteola]|uniref:DUF4625 domain-containing protein n=1 Tax=Longitalea luteola TaxID=2812563 RepID=UPI001A968F14|nr:DUF4625 domain-containing protein [Longitalea luteola]